MTLATFDKQAHVDSLKASGVSEDQARAHATALDTALHDVVATKVDLKIEICAARNDFLLMMLGQTALLIAVIAVLIKLL